MMTDDTYDESKEGFGPPITDAQVASLKAELDKQKPVTYTHTTIAPKVQKAETKMAEPKAKIDNSKIRELDPKVLKVEENFNARDYSTKANQEHVRNLANSIKEVGVLEALTVRYDSKTGEYYIVNGESRLRATLLAIKEGAAIKAVPVNFERKGTSNEQRIAGQITRNEGKQFDVLEQAKIFKQLSDFGWKDAEIAKATGRTGPFVGGALKLANAPAKLKALISEGTVSATMVIDLARGLEFDWDKAIAAISDAQTTATMLGKKKVTAAHVDPAKKGSKKGAKADSSTPLHYQRGSVNVFITALAEMAANTGLPKGVRNDAKDALDNAGIEAKAWLAEYELA